MMKRYLLCIPIVLHTALVLAQPLRYGNEWIDYTRPHYKLKVTADGFYRIPYATLAAAIPNIASVNPANIALYHNGTQEPLTISTSTSFGPNDYIEFYGRKNIGDMDSVLYPGSNWQPHIYRSFFTDTSVYFLVVNNSTNNKRYIEVANDTTLISSQSLPEELFFWHYTRQAYTTSTTFPGGVSYFVGSHIFKPIWDKGEGFGSAWINFNAPLNVSLPTTNLYPTGSAYCWLRNRVLTRSHEDHDIKGTFNGHAYYSKQFFGSDWKVIERQVPMSQVGPTNTMRWEELSPMTIGNQNILMYAELEYPRSYNFSGQANFLWRLKESTGPRFFRLLNYTTAGVQPLLYDLTNGLVFPAAEAVNSTTRTYVLPALSGERELYIRQNPNAGFTNINSLDTITFQDYRALALQSDYIIISNKNLMTDSAGVNQVEAYRQYRDKTANPVGGRYDAKAIFDIDQLYDQFGYGIRKTPLAIRNFIEYAYDKWSKKPTHLFIIGKARDYREVLVGGQGQTAAQAYAQCQVPTWGRPASDNLLVMRRNSNRPLVAVGRLAAQRGEQVRDYLAKIRQYESLQNRVGDPYQTKREKLWMKNLMHFGGGETSIEQAELAGYIDDWTARVQDTLWGANVTSFYKTSSAPIDITQREAIAARRDSGVALMTLFGHSAGTATDIDIDQPENWTNYEKYPLIFSNGCLAGSIHDPATTASNTTFSERFVLVPGRGAVAFTATSGSSVSSNLYNYGTFVYERLRKHAYNTTWGNALKEALIDNDSIYGLSDLDMFISYEMTLHGDPALRLHQYPKPDYEIDDQSVYFTPPTIDAASDSFWVNVIVTNLGKAIKDSIEITLTRKIDTTGNGTATNAQYLYKKMFRATYYRDTFSFKLPTLYNRNYGYGPNEFQVFVESKTRIDEMSETNNGNLNVYTTFIQSDDVIPIWPYEFAIVPNQKPVLKASTVNVFAPMRTYKFEIDTSEKFQTLLGSGTITQVGGVLHWQVPFQMKDSTVYYWRVGIDSGGGNFYRWKYSSYLYLKDEYPGWNQSHFYQWQKDNYDENIYLDNDRVFKYRSAINSMYAMAGWSNSLGGPVPFSNVEWQLNNVNRHRYRMGSCGFTNGLTFGVVDTNKLEVWSSANTGTNYGRFGNFHCSSQLLHQNGFDFFFDNSLHPTLGIPWFQVVSNFLDSIPDGAYVVMYSSNRPAWNTMPQTLKTKLMSYGASLLPLYVDSGRAAPYIFFFQKGVPTNVKQITGSDYLTAISGTFDFRVRRNYGSYETPLIGPATEWGSVHWRWRSSEINSSDKQHIELYGVTQNGMQQLLLTTTTLDTTLNFVNAAFFPYLKMKMVTQDDSTHTPAQNYYWRVLFKEAPEAAMNPQAYFKIEKDTVGIGDSVDIGIALENVSVYDMDSMRTKYVLQNLHNQAVQNFILKQDSLRLLDTMILHFKQPINGNNFEGKLRLSIEANPLDALHQREKFHFNNYAFIDFNTIGDKINPLLDVTFDGRHIMNGDIVSAKPNILISLRDENKHLALNDTALLQVYVKYPGQTQPVYVPYDGNVLTFYPATGNLQKMNRARVEFRPTFTVDGIYELYVDDRDRSRNSSSKDNLRLSNGTYHDYKVAFEIINKPMISNVLNYPNPFSTSTQFVFTLTGSEVPTYMKIQIMTINGRVVKEITKEELGAIKIGHNRSDYRWDGRDTYGDKLANGVYFYRIISSLNGQPIEHMASSGKTARFFNNTNIDHYFKKGFGKLVILR